MFRCNSALTIIYQSKSKYIDCSNSKTKLSSDYPSWLLRRRLGVRAVFQPEHRARHSFPAYGVASSTKSSTRHRATPSRRRMREEMRKRRRKSATCRRKKRQTGNARELHSRQTRGNCMRAGSHAPCAYTSREEVPPSIHAN